MCQHCSSVMFLSTEGPEGPDVSGVWSYRTLQNVGTSEQERDRHNPPDTDGRSETSGSREDAGTGNGEKPL